MKVLAIDPGYERLGIAVIEKTPGKKESLLFSECFRTSAEMEFHDRLGMIGKRVQELILEHAPKYMAIENLFMSNNQKTAMRVAEVRGAIIFLANSNGLLIKEMTPLQIKLSVTGDGKSSKDQMMKMVDLLLGLRKKVQTSDVNSTLGNKADKKMLDDEYDAIAAGLAFFAYHREPFK